MDTDSRSNVVPLFPESNDDDSSTAGWDPYIFSIVAQADRPYGDDRRRAPRMNTPVGRRALLLAKGRRKKE
jgi:hypothetical protein